MKETMTSVQNFPCPACRRRGNSPSPLFMCCVLRCTDNRREAKMLNLLAVLLLCSSCGVAGGATSRGSETDRLALLAFRDRLVDPAGALSSWNGSNHFCQWLGVSCTSRRHADRVTGLNVVSRRLSGPISAAVANLTFLHAISLSDNGLYGEIPAELGRLRRLRLLNLSYNSFHGEIPANLSLCSALRSLSLGTNRLTGRIPAELGLLSKLDTLSLGNNSLSGPIPPSLGNLTSLAMLSLPLNQLTGPIPDGIGELEGLRFFQVGVNMLSGEMPPTVYNLSSLRYFGVAFNNLISGSLPPNLGISLPNLQSLLIAGNKFHGGIPASITNMTGLLEFNIASNNFSGTLPPNLGTLRGLRYVNLGINQLEAREDADWKFLDSLSNCSNLQKLILSENRFGGVLPPSVANLSTGMQKLEVPDNQISGSIPSEIGNLAGLNSLQMQDNLLTGTIPASIGGMKNLYLLGLFRNALGGTIPSSLGNLTRLLHFRLDENNLEGPIPPTLGNLNSLITFDLSNNNVGGNIPREILSLGYLSNYMDLSYNNLDGSLPLEVGSLRSIASLLIRSNKLSGEIPSTLGTCTSLEYLGLNRNFFSGTIPQALGNLKGLKGLNLSQNNLSGTIPQSFSKLAGIRELYLSHNNLSGSIPGFMENLTSLTHLTLSFNNLQGEVPTHGIFENATAVEISGNRGLCGGIPVLHFPSCPPSSSTSKRSSKLIRRLVIVLVAALLSFFVLAFSAYAYWKRRSPESITAPVPVVEDQFPKISYRELYKATGSFSSINLIGVGRYGSVYKGTLDGDGTFVAVKVFKLGEQGASRSFIAECEALRNVRHRNLVKILTSCSSSDRQGIDFKALVFEYMPNGSLDAWLHRGEAPDDQRSSDTLSLVQRLNVAIDVANALEYLHHSCQPPIIHCDLKPGNVLLDGDMRARVGDFGLAKFYRESGSTSLGDSSSLVGIRGTVGYVAPEYGAGGQPTTCGDIYSYGILVLELFTGRRPVDSMFEDGMTLCKFVETGTASSSRQVLEVVDPSMPLTDHEVAQECVASAVRVGLGCADQTPGKRMHIRDAIAEMSSIKAACLQLVQHP